MTSLLAGSRTIACAARRGSGILPASRSSAARARGPEMRTTATAASPRPLDSAKIVSPPEVISVEPMPRVLR